MRHLIAGALACLLVTPASAGVFYDGNWLYDQCTAKDGTPQAFVCAAYLAAVAESLDYGSVAKHEFNICLQGKTRLLQLHDVVVYALAAAPERRTDPAFTLAAAALRKAWPCPWQH
jgi:hypothetical protein